MESNDPPLISTSQGDSVPFEDRSISSWLYRQEEANPSLSERINDELFPKLLAIECYPTGYRRIVSKTLPKFEIACGKKNEKEN